MNELADLLEAARSGDASAVDKLCAAMYQDLRRLARSRLRVHLRGTLLDTTALVHESYLRLVRSGGQGFADKAHFMNYAGRVMRSVIVDFVRAQQAERRGGLDMKVTLNTDLADMVGASEVDVIRINDALEELAKLDERLVKVVELRYFVGLNELETAAVLGVSDRTVRRDWEKAKLLLRSVLN